MTADELRAIRERNTRGICMSCGKSPCARKFPACAIPSDIDLLLAEVERLQAVERELTARSMNESTEGLLKVSIGTGWIASTAELAVIRSEMCRSARRWTSPTVVRTAESTLRSPSASTPALLSPRKFARSTEGGSDA